MGFAREQAQLQPEVPSTWEVYRTLLRDPNQRGVMVMHFALFTSFSGLMVLFPLQAMAMLGEAGSPFNVGALFGITAGIGALSSPLGGYLADRFGRKKTVVPAACLIALGATLTTGSGAGSFTGLLPSVMMWGMGNSLCSPGLSAFAADLTTDEKTRGQALSLSRMSSDAALLVAPLGLGALAQLTSCTVALHATAAIVMTANLTFALGATEKRAS